MTTQGKEQRELLEIMLAAAADDLAEEQAARFSQLVLEDESLATYAAQLLVQEAWLSSRGLLPCAEPLLTDWPLGASRAADPTGDATRALAPDQLLPAATSEPRAHSQAEYPAAERAAAWTQISRWKARRWLSSAVAAAALLVGGALLGELAARWEYSPGRGRVGTMETSPLAVDARGNAHSLPPYAARFVQETACVWGPGTVPPGYYGGGLRSGESINLMEGLADIEVDLATGGSATLQIEGPARMFLTTEGIPSLTLGRLSAKVHPTFGDFTLETPFGQIVVLQESSIGVSVHGLEVEVHVFAGEVDVVSPWTSELNSLDHFHVVSGESLRLSAADSNAMAFTRGVAHPASFASQLTMVSDRLRIPPAYTREVMRAAPLMYWRFEDASDGTIRNEVGDRFQGIVAGAPEWSVQDGNRAIEFGTGLTSESLRAYVEASDTLGDSIDDSYTVELWVKPSHYHLGTLVSLVRNPPPDSQPGLHGMLLELGGPLITPSTIEHPGRIRFLHRAPPSNDPETGTSIFSKSPYELRRWAYLVATKQGPDMRLYVNGRQVAEAEDDARLPEDLVLLIGQLDRHRGWRRFVGQLDELAVYDRALSDSEIRRHYELVRPNAPPREVF